MIDLREKQAQYEEETDSIAAAERLEQLRSASNGGDVDTPRAQRFIARAYAEVKRSLDDALEVKTRGVGGKFKGWLRAIPTDVAAVLAIRECISQLCLGNVGNKAVTVQNLASSLGRLYHIEVRIREAEKVNPLYMMRVHDQVREHNTTSKSHLNKLYNKAYANVMKDAQDNSLSNQEMIQLGKFGVQACMDAGIVELNKGFGKNGKMYTYELAPAVLEFLTSYSDADVQTILNKDSGAMMCEPDPWTDLRDGGYLSLRRKNTQPLMPLAGVRKSERSRLRGVFTAEAMPVVFEAANYLQDVPFEIKLHTLTAIKRVWEQGGGILGVPRRNAPVKPAFPFPEEWVRDDATEAEMAVLSAWKRQAQQYYSDLREWRGKVREISGFVRVASKHEGNVWFPVFFDKRGRWYYRGVPNPQGSDLAKASIHFGRKKPLGQRGLYWLRVHIANCFGYDKERFDSRAQWTIDNWDTIQNALDEPENHADVWGTDAPWCMYSAAYELREALRSGNPEEYETSVPVHMDATCSGLQHFSAMLRDPIGGGYTNLYDDSFVGPKQDIYSRVSTNALAQIKLDSEGDEETAQMALFWLRAGIPRKMAKTPVMTYVYGATLRGTVDFVQAFAEDEMGLEWPEGKRPYDYAAYCAKKLFQGIAATVPAADSAMQWLRSVAKSMPKGQRMEWTAPTGFKVQHDYQDFDEVRVKLRSCGVESALVREYNEDTRPLPMQNAISPNFVHALDAAHLTFTALAMKAAGCDMVGIHDSFGTHPSDVDTLHRCIREQFVHLYQARNVLSDFLWEVNGVGEAPMRGTLDLERVKQSEFFFC